MSTQYRSGYGRNAKHTALTERYKNALYLSVYVFSTKVLIRDIIFTSPHHVTWSAGPREGLAACSYFKTQSIGPAPGIKPATSRSAVKRSTDCADTAAVWWC